MTTTRNAAETARRLDREHRIVKRATVVSGIPLVVVELDIPEEQVLPEIGGALDRRVVLR